MEKKENRFQVAAHAFHSLGGRAATGILAGLAGTLLDEKGSALLSKYSAYKSLMGNHSPAEIKAALEKRGISVP